MKRRGTVDLLQSAGWLAPGERESLIASLERDPSFDIIAHFQRSGRLSPEQAASLRSREEVEAPSRSPFEVLGELGRGGMGTVLRVRDGRFDREVALKRLNPDAGADAEARFLREAKIMARLDHPNIPPVFEFGRGEDGLAFYVMPIIRGETLAERLAGIIARGELRERRRELIEVLCKVCEAMGYAHSEGVIHRDLKPENIMVGPHGEVLVLDWGIARDLEDNRSDALLLSQALDVSGAERQGLTIAGAVLGTPGYMAPEQALGEPVDIETDVFALGAILVEVLTGRRPMEGETVAEILTKAALGQIRAPRDYDRSIPRSLDALARVLLAEDPRRRLPGAAVMLANLRAWLDDRPLDVLRESLIERLQRRLRRGAGGFALAAAALLIAALGVALILTQRLASDRIAALEVELGGVRTALAELEAQPAEVVAAPAVNHLALAKAAVDADDYPRALAHAQLALDADSSSIVALQERSTAFVGLNLDARALEDFARLEELGALRERDVKHLCIVLERRGEARANLERARDLAARTPRVLETYAVWGKAGIQLNEPSVTRDALAALKAELERGDVEMSPEVGFAFVEMLRRTGQLEAAQGLLGQIWSGVEAAPTAWHLRGMILFGQKRYAEAKAAFETALRLGSTDDATVTQIISCCRAEGDHVATVEAFQRFFTDKPAKAELTPVLAGALLAIGKGESAHAQLKRYLRAQRGLDDVLVMGIFASLDLPEPQLDEARAFYHIARLCFPKQSRIAIARGLILRQEGRTEEALALFESFVEDPKHTDDAIYQRFRTLLDAGRREEARAEAERLERASPESPLVRIARRRLEEAEQKIGD